MKGIHIIRRHGEQSTFKLAYVLGPSRAPGKLRALVYSAASKSFSNPQAVREVDILPIDPVYLNARQRSVYQAARVAAYARKL